MKNRFGFVSNSSSSSFIVHHSEFPSETHFNRVMKELDDIKDSEGEYEEWGERGGTWYAKNGYLMVETYYVYDEVVKAFKNAEIDFENLKKFWIEG